MSSLVSVIVPHYNRLEFLQETIQSLANQSYESIEVIVVDDGSDSTIQRKLSETLSGSGVLIRLFFQDNQGAPAARNRGIREARGDYVLFLDSDDCLKSDGLTVLARELQNPDVDYVYGRVAMMDETLSEEIGVVGSGFTDSDREIGGYHWHTMAAMYRKELIGRVGFWNETLVGSQDWEYQARIKLTTHRKKYVENVIGVWRQHAKGRIGTSSYNHDYQNSVLDASVSIASSAKEAGKLDDSLAIRLAGKMTRHGLAAAYQSDRELFDKAMASVSLLTGHMMLPRTGVAVLTRLPVAAQRFLARLLGWTS